MVISAEVDQHFDDGMKRENTLRKQIQVRQHKLLHDDIFQLNASSLEVLISHQPSNREMSQRMRFHRLDLLFAHYGGHARRNGLATTGSCHRMRAIDVTPRNDLHTSS